MPIRAPTPLVCPLPRPPPTHAHMHTRARGVEGLYSTCRGKNKVMEWNMHVHLSDWWYSRQHPVLTRARATGCRVARCSGCLAYNGTDAQTPLLIPRWAL